MTTYCLDHTKPFEAKYQINTATMPTANVVFSELTVGIDDEETVITVKNGEGQLFQSGMIATLEQFNSEGKATAREVVSIAEISGDNITIVRGIENCVIDDTASPKVMGNTPQTFTTGARISVYVSRALLNGVQVRLQQCNCPCSDQVYNDTMALSNTITNCCDYWYSKLYDLLAQCCGYRNCIFGNGCDGDLTITTAMADSHNNYFLCANKVYQFNNLTICSGVCVRFEKQGVPIIRVRGNFINRGVIDMRGGMCTGCCTYSDDLTGTTIANLSCNWGYRQGGASKCGGCPGCPGSDSSGGAGGKTTDCQWTDADGLNGGHGGRGPIGGNPPAGGGGGGGGGGRYGNGGVGGGGGCNTYQSGPNRGGDGGNSSYWGCGGNGGEPGRGYSGAGGGGGNGGNGFYVGGIGGCNSDDGAGKGGCGVLKGGKGGCGGSDAGGTAGCGGDAITNVYGLLLTAKNFDNTGGVICSRGGDGGEGGTGYRAGCDCRYTTDGGHGGNGADGGCTIIVYGMSFTQGTIDNRGGACGLGGTPNSNYSDGGSRRRDPGNPGNPGSCKICKIFNR